jgi:hypothetical protein
MSSKARVCGDRDFVEKAESQGLRTIGRRNTRLNGAALKAARKIQRLYSKGARWIAADAGREQERVRALKHCNRIHLK